MSRINPTETNFKEVFALFSWRGTDEPMYILSTNGRNLNERVKFYTNPSLFIQIETLNL